MGWGGLKGARLGGGFYAPVQKWVVPRAVEGTPGICPPRLHFGKRKGAECVALEALSEPQLQAPKPPGPVRWEQTGLVRPVTPLTLDIRVLAIYQVPNYLGLANI